jgi:Ca2+-binding RTX toxin-like protein
MARPARALITAALAATFAACTDTPEPPAGPPEEPAVAAPEPRIPPRVAADLRAGKPREVLVLVDDREVRAHAAHEPASGEDPLAQLAFRAHAYARTKAMVLEALPAEHAVERRRYRQVPYLHLSLRSPEALAALDRHPEVVRVYEDRANEAFLTNSLPLIHQPAAATAGKTGSGGTVVVIDTGLDYTLPAFGSCVSPGTPGSCRVPYAADIAADDGQLDANGHGTNVAGIVAGVAPGAQVIGLDVFNAQNQAMSTDVIAAIDWTIAHKAAYGIVAINMSLGGGAYTSSCGSDVFAAAVANARSAGILSAIATGNSGYPDKVASPACVPGAVSVGAVYSASFGGLGWATPCTDASTAADQVTCFSNSASFMTLLAPGAMITAAGITEGGTSQASPHVAGAIAVLRTAFPLETVTQTVQRMTTSGTPITDPRQSRVTPRLDLDAASQGCFLQAAPSALSIIEAGAAASVAVTVGAGCAWTASSGAGWLTVTSGASGTGSGTVSVTAAQNPGPASRSTTLTIAGVSVPVAQDGDPPPSTAAPPSCMTASASGYNASTKTLALSYASGQPTMIVSAAGTDFLVNGESCVTPAGAVITPSMLNHLTITGTAADETLVLDLAPGALPASLLGGNAGIVIDLGGGSDAFNLRGTSGNDKVTMGAAAGAVYVELSGDSRADVKISNAEAYRISLGDGKDTFSGMGGTITAAHFGGPTTLGPMTADLEVWGGDGDDTLQGGMGNDILHGGNGDDTFLTHTAADGDDVYYGDAGNDTMSYAKRTAGVTVTMDGLAGDGDLAAGESDNVGIDVENLIGGDGNDVLVGNAASNWIRGGKGNDVLSGGAAGSSCSGILDTLDGEAGNDTFDMGAAAGCPAKLIGGVGTDTADFRARTNGVYVTLNNLADDGESSGAEGINVGSDIERVLGGSGNDHLTGGAGNDELHGGPGNDVIHGGGGDDVLIGGPGNDELDGDAGNDTFLEGCTDNDYNPPIACGAGSDVINGGTGTADFADYAGRVADLSLTICTDPTATAGNSALTAAACTDSDGALGEGDKLVNVNHVRGGDGNDTITGGSGDDTLEGGPGNDVIHGGPGNDWIYGDAGNDQLFGDAGDDLLDSGAGVDQLDGGQGDGDVCIAKGGDVVKMCEL